MTDFVIADTHFGHKGVCRFLRDDGSKLRPWDTTEEMDEAMVALWNATVGPKDKVYVLGDFCINRKALPTAGRLNGDKVLIKGNHDVFRLEEYTPYFRDIRAYTVLERAILSHIPVHPTELVRFKLNIHGHLHDRAVQHYGRDEEWFDDPRYVCVSAEQTGYKPIPLEQALKTSES